MKKETEKQVLEMIKEISIGFKEVKISLDRLEEEMNARFDKTEALLGRVEKAVRNGD